MDREEQHLAVMALYARAVGIVDPVRIRAWSDADLTTTQLRVLFALRDEGGATMGALASLLRVSAPAASGVVDRLVRQGYVRREDDPQDRRVVRHQLTEAGMGVVATLEREGRALMHAVLGRLTEEQLDRLMEALEALTAAADEALGAPAGGVA